MNIPGERIPGTARTPDVALNHDGVISIKGRLTMENGFTFSKILSDWYDKYIFEAPFISSVNISLEYFSGLNIFVLISFMRKILFEKGLYLNVTVNWYYENDDEDILELGKYISNTLGKPFNFIRSSESSFRADASKLGINRA